MSSNDSGGCFIVIAVILAIFGVVLLLGEGCKEFKHEYYNDPGGVIRGIFILAAVAFVIHYIAKKVKN
ncbi:hypothetical protein SAMN05421841_1872 [Chryseobacterium wanjuense]|uniref:Uncharacterized protein n=1 Tax=Chryseobacterium wanjuense TaxID=356305 RepID=A0A1I0QFU2_9FLAO|nr:hypothetical protein [Chryseobacterium wanjuense]SEW25783.1 hypothetical protein SAMN05421841_1872 [Chryseobacterium wanjuense]